MTDRNRADNSTESDVNGRWAAAGPRQGRARGSRPADQGRAVSTFVTLALVRR